jgi:hypothetical protein
LLTTINSARALKRMVLLRIAELEAVSALQHAVVEAADPAGPSGLPHT